MSTVLGICNRYGLKAGPSGVQTTGHWTFMYVHN